MFRAELRNIILSSIALQLLFNRSSITHQLLFNGSSNAHQTLIKHSSNAHQTLIFFRILYALPKSPRVILRALCGYASYCTSAYVFCAVYLMAGTFQHDITAPPASSPDRAPADCGKARNKSAARRQRARQSARADIVQRLQRHVDLLREKLAAIQQELANEKDRRNAISAEHFTISQSLLRTQQLLDEARASGEAPVQAVEVKRAKELVRDRASREQRHQLDLRTLRERSDLLRERATLDVQTAQALAGRLRQEQNQARQDALRYNQGRNEARAELVALRTQQSAAAVRAALAPILSLSAE
jgi:hypothetical protein